MPLLPYSTSPTPQAPLTPSEQMQASQAELQQLAQAQLEEIRRRKAQEQQQQAQNPIASAAGSAVMDQIVGDGASSVATPQVLNGVPVSMGPTPAYIPAAVIMSTAAAGNAAMNMVKGETDNSPAGKFGRATLGTVTGGLSEVGNKVADMAGLHHKSTKDYEKERWGALAKNSGLDTDTVKHFANLAHPAGDTGEGWTPEVEATAMKDPQAMAGQLGLLQTFGADYFSKMNEFERFAAARAAIDNGLLDGDHGDILVTDPEKLKSILPQYVADEKVQQEYNAFKANQAQAAPQGSTQDFDSTLDSALAGINAQAREDAKKANLRGLAIKASAPPEIPKFGGGAIQTGVQSLDNILGGVLR